MWNYSNYCKPSFSHGALRNSSFSYQLVLLIPLLFLLLYHHGANFSKSTLQNTLYYVHYTTFSTTQPARVYEAASLYFSARSWHLLALFSSFQLPWSIFHCLLPHRFDPFPFSHACLSAAECVWVLIHYCTVGDVILRQSLLFVVPVRSFKAHWFFTDSSFDVS